MAVYFLKSGKRIKIGVAKDVSVRLRQLNAHAPGRLKLIGSVSGSFPLERRLHNELAAYRSKGEWFKDCPQVRAAIAAVLAASAPAPDDSPTAPARRKFGAVAKLLWPVKTANELAFIAKTDERTAKRWLRGEHEPPLSVVLAVIHEMLREQTELNLR